MGTDTGRAGVLVAPWLTPEPQAAMELPSGRRRVWSDLLNQACGMLIA